MIAEHELDLLAAGLTDPRLTASIPLTGAEFEHPGHGAIWDAMRTIHARGHVPSPTAILDETGAMGVRVDHTIFPGLVGRGIVVNADMHAARIRDAATRRTVYGALTSAAQQINTGRATDEIIGELVSKIGATTEAEHDSQGIRTLDEFVGQALPPEEWIIPDLLAKGDRVIVTGGEGGGKSMLIRQFAVCAAAGLHPFNFSNVDTRRVLMVDAENPKRIMIKRFSELRNAIGSRGLSCGSRLWIERRPQGLDLAQTRDRLLLHNLCMVTNPDLLVIGPAYKLYTGGSTNREEDLARQVTSTLDGLREEFGFALILEHHSPHGVQGHTRETRPIGSSLWRRWPEFGIGLAPTSRHTKDHREVEVVHWRGGRDQRPWPKQLESGGTLPWVDATPEQTMRNGYRSPDWTPHRILEETRA